MIVQKTLNSNTYDVIEITQWENVWILFLFQKLKIIMYLEHIFTLTHIMK